MESTWLNGAVLALALTASSLLAYSLRILDAKGSLASFLLGAVILWAGGLPWFGLMVVFTGLAFVATRFGRRRKLQYGTAEARDGERGAPNVVANGAAPAIVALIGLLNQWLDGPFTQAGITLAFVTAVAAITADTLASEIGGLSSRARSIMPPFPKEAPGTNGAVSWLGQAAALLGPAIIVVSAVPLLGMSLALAWVAVLAGFMGSQIDSILGALWEEGPRHPDRPLSKGDVNFIASFLPTVAVLVALWLASL